MSKINKVAFAIFGKYVRDNKEDYSGLRTDIAQAHLVTPWDIYASTTYLYTAVIAILCFILGFIFIPFWRFIYSNVYIEAIRQSGLKSFETISNNGEILFILILVFLLPIFSGLVTYKSRIAYPGLISRIRKSKIDHTLPHAVAYMYALSKGELNLIPIFTSLSENTDVYGEAAEEIKYILLDIDMHGKDLLTALKNAANGTQSEMLRDFLENLVNIVETGADIESYFSNVLDYYQKSAETDQNMYLETLGVLAETYITVFVAGPLFIIILMIVMGFMGSGSMAALKLLIYLVIPLCAIIFSILLSMISMENGAEKVKIYSVSKNINHYDDVKSVVLEDDEKRIQKLLKALRWTNMNEFRKNPFKLFFSDPNKAFYFTAPAAILFFFFTIYDRKITIDLLDDSIILSSLILFVPFLFFYNMQMRRIRIIENSIPGFLRRLAAINDVGMPLPDAIRSVSKANIGVLGSEVKLIYKDLAWSNSIQNALMKFERRIRTVSISRMVTLITKASETTGNIKETLKVAANDAALAEKIKRQKFATLFSYLVVVYISFAVFLMVLYVFTTMFLPHIPDSTASGYSRLSIGINKEEYVRLFMHGSIIQGFFSGIIIGQMIGGNVYDGLNHSILMITIAYVFFTVFI